MPQTQNQKLEGMADELISLTRLKHYDFSILFRLKHYDFSILFRLKMGLDNYGPIVFASPSPSSASTSAAGKSTSAAATEEKMVCDMKLKKYDAGSKIKVIKEIRGFTKLGLKEAKDLVEKVPAVVKKGGTKEEGNAISKQLGATVVLE